MLLTPPQPTVAMSPSRFFALILIFSCTSVGAMQINRRTQISKLTPRAAVLRSMYDRARTSPQIDTKTIVRSTVKARERHASLSPLFAVPPDNDDKSTRAASILPLFATPWARALLIFGLGYGIGGASAPGWQRHSRVATKIGVTKIALVILILRDVWRSTPTWVKPRISRYGRKIVNLFSVPFRRSGEIMQNELDDTEDRDDITDFSNFATKISGVMNVAKNKLEGDGGDGGLKDKDDFNVQASFLAALQLLWQLKSRRSSSRDQMYRSSGTAVPDEMLDGLDERFELADLAYNEHPDGDIKEVLKGMEYNLIKHDTTVVPGYLGHYIAINSDPSKGKTAIIGVKGTSNFEDFLTDMCASSVEYNLTHPFYEGGGNTLRCHEGVMISSQRLAKELLPVVQNLLIPSGYKITIVGHSLGAGCATLLAMLLRSSIPSLQSSDKLKVWAFASPPILDLNSALGCSSFVTTVVNNCDVIPRANISPFVVTVRLLRAVNKRLKERNLDMSNFQSTVAFLNKIREGKDGEMLMTADEVGSELDSALEKVDLQDVDHLYVPGKVLVMYDLWEKEQQKQQDQNQEETDFTNILKDWTQLLKDTNVHPNAVVETIPTAGEAILCDGTCKALRFVELDGRLLDDHMAPQYRSSIGALKSR